MNTNEIIPRLNEVFRDVFGDSSISVTEKTTADDIEDWDSLAHISLIVSIEKHFQVKFSLKQVSELKSFGKIADALETMTM